MRYPFTLIFVTRIKIIICGFMKFFRIIIMREEGSVVKSPMSFHIRLTTRMRTIHAWGVPHEFEADLATVEQVKNWLLCVAVAASLSFMVSTIPMPLAMGSPIFCETCVGAVIPIWMRREVPINGNQVWGGGYIWFLPGLPQMRQLCNKHINVYW